MSLLLSLSLSFTAHAATPEQVACVAERSKYVTQVEDQDGLWYHATSFAAQDMRPVPYVELIIMPYFPTVAPGKRMAMYDYNNDGIVDYATWHKEIAPNTWVPIRPRWQYMSNWYLPNNVSPVNPIIEPYWQEKFDEALTIIAQTRHC